MFEEENYDLLFELPFYQSSSPPTTHDTDSSKNIEPIPSKDPPRVFTVFSNQSQADKTKTGAIDISIHPNESPSTVQPRRTAKTATRVGDLAICSTTVTRSLHANQIRISSSTSQTTHDAKKAEIILNTPVIVSHIEGMNYLLKIQEALT